MVTISQNDVGGHLALGHNKSIEFDQTYGLGRTSSLDGRRGQILKGQAFDAARADGVCLNSRSWIGFMSPGDRFIPV